MKSVVVIPARLASSRFPRKVLYELNGKSTLEHVYRRSAIALGDDNVWIATCDAEIKQSASKYCPRVVMTKDTHIDCNDRVVEAAQHIAADIVVIVQGDEPVLDPRAVHMAIEPFKKNPACLATNLIKKIDPNQEDPRSYNVVKAVVNTKNQILYMSREPIPTPQRAPGLERTYYRQLGIMGFRADFLQLFGSLPRGPLEQAEGVEMNRVIENGYPLEYGIIESNCLAIDVPEDVPGIERALRADQYTSRYTPQS